MKQKGLIIIVVVVLVIFGGAVALYRYLAPTPVKPAQVVTEDEPEVLPQADTSVIVDVARSRSKDSTIVLKARGLAGKIVSVEYEITYDSLGLIKGVNSGSKPILLNGGDVFEREVYLGTCSKNVCKPEPGVTKVSVVLKFTDTEGKKSQFSKEYDL